MTSVNGLLSMLRSLAWVEKLFETCRLEMWPQYSASISTLRRGKTVFKGVKRLCMGVNAWPCEQLVAVLEVQKND